MIPRANITAWRSHAPWPTNAQVEQDLVQSRALVAMFQHEVTARHAVFRGGTALHKLFFDTPGRYSEDIDLVQCAAGPIGELIDSLRETLDPWLGTPKWKQRTGRFVLLYRFETTFHPISNMRLKIEINTREHFSVLGITRRSFTVDNPWFQGSVELPVYHLAELLGTKVRALYQRKKGRDLYDLSRALRFLDIDDTQVMACFSRYMAHDGARVSRAEFEANLAGKLKDDVFLEDLKPLIPGLTEYDPASDAALVQERLIRRLSGAPWKGTG